MKINTCEWREFTVGEIFNILNGKGITQEEIELNPGSFAAVQSGEDNNGIIGRIDRNYCIEQGYTMTDDICLTVARSGTSGFVSFQAHGCVVGDSAKILLLKDRTAANTFVYLFLQTILLANQYKYSYGRKVTEDKYKLVILKLPTNPDGTPDWVFMEQFIKTLHHKPITTCISQTNKLIFDISQWGVYRLGDYFIIEKGKRLTAEDQTQGETPYIGAIDSNNGLANKIGQYPIHSGNTISLSYNGSVGEAFYQPRPFWATDDVNVLYFKQTNGFEFNQYIAIFICSVLKLEKYRFSYGRKWTKENMESSIVKLPKKNDGSPDWAFMEKYIKSLPYGDRI